jgi:hypothetical protein
MRKQCYDKILEKYLPAIRGLGKSRMASALMLYELRQHCAETEEEKEIIKLISEVNAWPYTS